MNLLRTTVALFSGLVCGTTISATELEVTIRPHAAQTVFGDPLYVEVTIVNRGAESISAPNPALDENTFDFIAYDPETRVSKSVGIAGHGFGDPGRVTYAPGKVQRHFWKIFLPGLATTRHSFWEPYRSGRNVVISGVYYLDKRVSVSSNAVTVFVEARDEKELTHLERWHNAKAGFTVGPSPTDFGVQLKSSLNRDQTLQVFGPMRESELADLFQLTTRLQDIHAAKPEFRGPHEKMLIEWLEKQPREKRMALSNELAHVAQVYNLLSTKRGVEKLLAAPDAP